MPKFDPKEKSLEELEEILNAGSVRRIASAIEEAEADPPTTEEPNDPGEGETPKPEPPAPEKVAPEKKVEEKPEPASEAKPAAEVEEDDPKALMAEIRSRLEEESLRRQKLEAELEHQRQIASREAGRAGHFERLAKKPAPKREATIAEELDEEEAAPAGEHPDLAPLRAEMEEIRSELSLRAFSDEADEFFRRRPDANEEDKTDDAGKPVTGFKTRFMKHLPAQEERYQDELFSGNVKIARQAARMAYEAAYVEAKLEVLAEVRAAVKPKRAEQFAATRDAKLKANVAGSGQTGAPRAATKAHADKTLKELEDELESLLR